MSTSPRLLALSDLHVAFPENRKLVEDLRPESEQDWLLLAGDVGELSSDIRWALALLSERFATVVWTPGNHDLWTHRDDPRVTWHDGVRFEEVSIGYPRERQRRARPPGTPRQILAAPADREQDAQRDLQQDGARDRQRLP
jgi:predicted phosphodiesterase